MKAVLVIDVDEKSIGRKVNYISVQGGGYSYIVGTMGMDARLRPLPEKMIPEMVIGNKFAEGCVQGWNDCLDEIMGETE